MDLLASIFTYLGTVAGIVVAIALSYNSLMLHMTRVPQATTVEARSSTPKTPKPKPMHKAEVGRAPFHVNRYSADEAKTRTAAPQRLSRAKQRSRHLASERSGRQFAHGLHSWPKEWANRPAPRAPYAFGYAEVPRAPFGNSGFE